MRVDGVGSRDVIVFGILRKREIFITDEFGNSVQAVSSVGVEHWFHNVFCVRDGNELNHYYFCKQGHMEAAAAPIPLTLE